MAEIQYLGHSCFRLRGRDGVVLTDPFGTQVGYDIGKPTAHIVTISHGHDDHNNIEAVKSLREPLFVADGPGEYEVSNVLMTGVGTYHDDKKGEERGRNTVFVIHLDDVVFCHLGDLGHELTAAQVEEIGDVDVLFVPVGGNFTIDATLAATVIGQIEPRIAIPMHYAYADGNPLLAPVDKFMAEMGMKEFTPEDKLAVTASSLPAAEAQTRILVLNPAQLTPV